MPLNFKLNSQIVPACLPSGELVRMNILSTGCILLYLKMFLKGAEDTEPKY
jgi:hypothetical protein